MRLSPRIAACAALLMAATAARPADPEWGRLVSREAGGTVPVEGIYRLELLGFHGEIAVRAGKAGELRYMAVDPADSTVPRSLELRQNERTWRLAPPEGTKDAATLLELTVPPSVKELAIDGWDLTIEANNIAAALQVRGEGIDCTARALHSSALFDIDDGSLKIDGVAEPLTINGEQLALDVKNVGGAVWIDVERASGRLTALGNRVEARLLDSELVFDGVTGVIRVEASGGRVGVNGAMSGGTLGLSGTPLELRGSKGSFGIDSDAAVRFEGIEGPLRVSGGAPIEGTDAKDKLDIQTNRSKINLQNLGGATTIQGDSLEVRIAGATSPLTVRTTRSDIYLERTTSLVTIESDGGDIVLLGPAGTTSVTARAGEIRAEEVSAPLQVRASGAEVNVAWSSLNHEGDSHVENEWGDVRVTLPAAEACRLQAETPQGHIEADIPGFTVNPSGTTASGALNLGKKPLLSFRAGGNIRIETLAPDDAPR